MAKRRRRKGIFYILHDDENTAYKYGATSSSVKNRLRNAKWKFKKNFRIVYQVLCWDVFDYEKNFKWSSPGGIFMGSEYFESCSEGDENANMERSREWIMRTARKAYNSYRGKAEVLCNCIDIIHEPEPKYTGPLWVIP